MERRLPNGRAPAAARLDLAPKLFIGGGALVALPLLLVHTALAPAIGGLVTAGLALLAAGGLLIWRGRTQTPPLPRSAARAAAAGSSPPAAATPSRSSERSPGPRPVFKRPRGTAAVPAPAPAPTLSGLAVQARPAQWNAEVFQAIEWRRFEAVVESLFQHGGFTTRPQSLGADGGVDIWLHTRDSAATLVGLVQCKHWHSQPVGIDKMRQLLTMMDQLRLDSVQYATTAEFTPEARAFGQTHGIAVLDVPGLLALIGKLGTASQQALLEVAHEGDYWRPTCINCGIKMLERKPPRGGRRYWGCSHFPRCRTTLPMRKS